MILMLISCQYVDVDDRVANMLILMKWVVKLFISIFCQNVDLRSKNISFLFIEFTFCFYSGKVKGVPSNIDLSLQSFGRFVCLHENAK